LHNLLFLQYILGVSTTWRTIWMGARKTIPDIWWVFLWYDLSWEGAA